MPSDAALPAASANPAPPGPFRAFWRAFRENRGAVIGLTVVSLIFLIAIFANLLAPHDPSEQFRGFSKLPPFWMEGSDPRFLLGTDAVGRDMLSRLMYGARVSLFIGIAVMAVSMVAGIACMRIPSRAKKSTTPRSVPPTYARIGAPGYRCASCRRSDANGRVNVPLVRDALRKLLDHAAQ